MATAGDVVEAALKRILVQAADAPLQADETADALDAMNNLMSSLEAKNIRLGYTSVDNVSDSVTIPDGALRGLIANLAIEIAPDYGAEVHQGLVLQAKEGMKSMRRLGRPGIQSGYGANFPAGSGNYESQWNEPYSYGTGTFSLTLSNSTTTFTATATVTDVSGYWSLEGVQGLDADTTGVVTNNTALDITPSVDCRLLATGDGTYTLSLYRSGVAVATKQQSLTSTASEIVLKATPLMNPGDTLSLKLTADTAANDVVILNAQFEGR